MPSLAVAVTVVVPTGKTLPAGALVVMVGDPQLSLPETLKFTTVDVAVLFNGKYTVMSAGQLIVGGVGSITVMT